MRDWIKQFILYKPMALRAVRTVVILIFPISWIHESGHALVCVSEGESFSWLDFLLLGVKCSDMPTESLMLYWSLGGIFGVIVSSALMIFKKVRKDKAILIGVSMIIASQFVNFFFETFAHFAYLHSPILMIIMLTILGILFVSLLRFFTPMSKSET